jgi:NADH-quinone oxidoreductase subunit L
LQGTNGKILWFVGLVTALLTSLYMFRLWYLAFLGKPRTHDAHPHESPWSMLGPLVILALLSIGGGWIGFGAGLGHFGAFLAPVVGAYSFESSTAHLEMLLSGAAVVVALLGWFIADLFYRQRPQQRAQLVQSFSGPYKLLVNKYYVDEIYGAVFVKGVLGISRYVLAWVVDGAILGGIAWLLAGSATLSGAILQRWQSGNLRSYAAWLAAGAAAVLLFALIPWATFWPASAHLFHGAAGH